MAEAQKKTNLDYVNEIWNIADYVRDVISRADYNKVVLPFALLRRLECALEPTNQITMMKTIQFLLKNHRWYIRTRLLTLISMSK